MQRKSLVVTLVLWLLILQACASHQKISSETWHLHKLSAAHCEKEKTLKTFGIWRQVSGGMVEFISYCNENILNYGAINEQKLTVE